MLRHRRNVGHRLYHIKQQVCSFISKFFALLVMTPKRQEVKTCHHYSSYKTAFPHKLVFSKGGGWINELCLISQKQQQSDCDLNVFHLHLSKETSHPPFPLFLPLNTSDTSQHQMRVCAWVSTYTRQFWDIS